VRGHIRRRGKDRWAIVIYVGRDERGKDRYKWHSFQGTSKEAEAECARLVNQVYSQQYAEPGKLTVAEYLEDWLEQARTTLRQSTWESYNHSVRTHITPHLGRLRLTKLTPLHVQRWERELLETGRKDGRGTALSPRTVRYLHSILRRALGQAVRLGLLARNVADSVDPPRSKRREPPAITPSVAETLLAAAQDHRLCLPVLLALATGMRRGEILGLRWEDLDLAQATAEVRQTLQASPHPPGYRFAEPKTERSRRRVALPHAIVAALREQRRCQAELKLALGPDYEDHGLVVCMDSGRPWAPNSLRQSFKRLCERAGLQGLRFHDLRHWNATMLLRAGVDPGTTAKQLGHSRVQTTLDIYSHVLPDMQRAAANAIDKQLRAANETANGFANEPPQKG